MPATSEGDEDAQARAVRTVFEQFLLSSPLLNTTSEGVRTKNTFIEVQESDDFYSNLYNRSTTCPANITEEVYQLVRTLTQDLPLMKTIAEGFEESSSSFQESPSKQATGPSVMTPTVVTGPADLSSSSECDEEVRYTTVMLRNIPNKYTQSSLLEALDFRGFQSLYDFFYLPVDFKNGCNMGYAFINFVDHSSAAVFMSTFKGYQLPAKSSKVCEVCWARVQGLQSNIDHYKNSPVNDLPDPEYRPLMFAGGIQVAFPRPDHSIRRSGGRRKEASSDRGGVTSSHSAPPGFAESPAAVKLFIGGLSAETREADLRRHFDKFGQVADVAVVIDKKTGISRGFGFCSFHEKEAGDRVMRIRQHLINGQSVGVRHYQPGK